MFFILRYLKNAKQIKLNSSVPVTMNLFCFELKAVYCKINKIPVQDNVIKLTDNLIFKTNHGKNKVFEKKLIKQHCNSIEGSKMMRKYIQSKGYWQQLNLIRESNDHHTNTYIQEYVELLNNFTLIIFYSLNYWY